MALLRTSDKFKLNGSSSSSSRQQHDMSKRKSWKSTYLSSKSRSTTFSTSISIKDLPPLFTAFSMNDEKARQHVMPSAQPSSAPVSRATSPTTCRDACQSKAKSPVDHYNNANAQLTTSQVLGSIPEHLMSVVSGTKSLPTSRTISEPGSRSNSISFEIRNGHSVEGSSQLGRRKRQKKTRLRESSPPAPT